MFPCISTGLFNFPSAQAALVAVRAVSAWFAEFKKVPMRVIFMLWTELDIQCYQAAMASTFPNSPEFKVRICDLVPDAKIFDDLGGLIIHAGAGLSADAVKDGFGLDYTSNELFYELYPGVVKSTPLRCLYETIGYEWDDVSVEAAASCRDSVDSVWRDLDSEDSLETLADKSHCSNGAGRWHTCTACYPGARRRYTATSSGSCPTCKFHTQS